MKNKLFCLMLVSVFLFSISGVVAETFITNIYSFSDDYNNINQEIKNINLNEVFTFGFILKNQTNNEIINNENNSCQLLIIDSNGVNINNYDINYNDTLNIWSIEFLNPKEIFNEEEYNFIINCDNGIINNRIFNFYDYSGVLKFDFNDNTTLLIFIFVLIIGGVLIYIGYSMYGSIIYIIFGIIIIVNNVFILGGFVVFATGLITAFNGGRK